MNKNEISIFDIVYTLVKYRKSLIIIVLSITILSLIISLILPKTYKSTVIFFPPPAESMGISGILGSFVQSSPTTQKLSSEAILVILNSRKLKEETIDRFDLKEVYGSTIDEFVLKQFQSNIEIIEVREGGFGYNPIVSVEFSFYDELPERAEAICSFYISKLDSIIKDLNRERIRSTFSALEQRYQKNLSDLKRAEEALENFQKKYGIYEIETQLKSAIGYMAELKSESVQLEIEINVLKNMVSDNNQRIQQLITRKNKLDEKYNSLIQQSEYNISEKLFQPLNRMPELIKEYARLYREVTVQGKVFEVLYPQYEQVKIQLDTKHMGIQILDYAQLPTYKEKPKRAVIVVAGFVFSIFLGLIFIYLNEYFASLKSKKPDEYDRWLEIRRKIFFR